MSKGKAQAYDEGFRVTASDLASNEKNDEPPVIGYRHLGYDGRSRIEFVTLNEFSGDEKLLPPGYDRDSLEKLKYTVELNSKRFRKARRWHWGTFATLASTGFGVGLASAPLSSVIGLQEALIVTGLGLGLMVVAIPVMYCESLFRKLFKVTSEVPTFEGELKAQQGFTSLISGERFKIESPNHESIHEAVKLLNMAWVVNDTLTALKEGKSNLEYVRKTSEIRHELAELEEGIEKFDKKLRAYEAEIEELLLRNND